MTSALYTGTVRHRRFTPVRHEFVTRVAMPLLDLDDLGPGGRTGSLLASVPARLCRFERADYLGDASRPLDEAVRDHVEDDAGFRPGGGVRLLANLRTAGFNFNPISLYFCGSEELAPQAVVFEVTSTPWGERRAYVAVPPRPGPVRDAVLAKSLHISPFMPMDLEYRFSCSVPGSRLSVRFELRRGGERVFDADLWLRRRELDRRGLLTLLGRYPLMPQRVVAGIYLQAARLAWQGAPFHAHPRRAGRDASLADDRAAVARGRAERDAA